MGSRDYQEEVIVYTLDTNAIIYYAQNEIRAVAHISQLFATNLLIYISAASVTEALSPKFLPKKELDAIEGILRGLIFVPVDMSIARQAAELRRGHGLKLGDALVAATALLTGSALVTRNVRDFRRVPNLAVQPI